MGRLQQDFLDRVERFCDRVLDVAEALGKNGVPRRIVDQLAAAGTSVGANVFEADEGMSRPDFCRSMAIATKELSETRFWLRLAVRRGWVPETRMASLEDECRQLKSVIGAMIVNSRTRAS